MSKANTFMGAVDLPSQGMEPVIEPMEPGQINEKDGPIIHEGMVERPGNEAMVHEEDLPEGPTVTKWEEWA